MSKLCYKHGWTFALAASLPMSAPALAAAQAASPAMAEWEAMLDSVRDLPQRILAKLPEDQRNDPLVQQEANQLAIGALTTSGIAVLGADAEHPMFLPLNGLLFQVGQPNADTVYRVAHVAPDGVYRLRGTRGSTRLAIIAQHGASPGDAAKPGPIGPAKGQPLDLDTVHRDIRGRFDVIVSAARPAGYTGDWWPLQAGTAKLMARLVASDWEKESDALLSIERIDTPVRRTRPTAVQLSGRPARVAAAANFAGPLLVGDPERVRGEGAINTLVQHKVDRGMLAGQFYYEGYYDLQEDEALLLEAKVPQGCRYWSLILTNHAYVTTDWYDNQSSLNDSQAKIDKDGVLRVVVSARDPRVANWLDTAGFERGLVQGRWIACATQPIPAARKVKLSQVRGLFPAGTPLVTAAERERTVRERRRAAQERRLW